VLQLCVLTMGQGRKSVVPREGPDEQGMRDQEVLRATRELAAYFKGRRTEREARAALKIIKAFVRDRERRDARSRPPLPGFPGLPGVPGVKIAKAPKGVTNRAAARDTGERPRRKRRRKPRDQSANAIEPQVSLEPSELSERDQRTSE
jgi:hypothetical protein